MILKYFKYKNRELLFVGSTWCLITSPFWSDIISFLAILFFGTPLSDFFYFLFSLGFIPIAHVTWMAAITSFFYKEKQKIVVIIFFFEAILFEILFISFLIIEPLIIGTRVPMSHVEWAPFTIFYFVFSILVFLLTGIIFALHCIKLPDKETKLKGKLLLIAFISFVIGTIIEIYPLFFEFKYVLSRIIIFSAALEFYLGFALPNWLKKRIL